eukprot:6211794-Pleurochrysis_carterae.AAC.1
MHSPCKACKLQHCRQPANLNDSPLVMRVPTLGIVGGGQNTLEGGRCRRHLAWRASGACRLSETPSTVHLYNPGATSRCASVRCVLRGFVSETE